MWWSTFGPPRTTAHTAFRGLLLLRPLYPCHLSLAVTWKISNKFVVVTIAGQAVDFRTTVVAAMASSAFPRYPSVLIDARAKTEDPHGDQLRQHADCIALLLSRREGSRCALVIGPRPHQYGLARMFAVFLSTEGVHAEIFTEIEEAERWLTPANRQKTGRPTG